MFIRRSRDLDLLSMLPVNDSCTSPQGDNERTERGRARILSRKAVSYQVANDPADRHRKVHSSCSRSEPGRTRPRSGRCTVLASVSRLNAVIAIFTEPLDASCQGMGKCLSAFWRQCLPLLLNHEEREARPREDTTDPIRGVGSPDRG